MGNIYLYIDHDNFLTAVQLKKLNTLKLDFTIRRWNTVTGYGEQTILNELEAFKEVGAEVDPESYIAKVDSDVLFLSDEIFLRVLKSDDLVVGQLEDYWEPFVYVQGGCYFLRSSLAVQLMDFDKDIFSRVLVMMNNPTAKSRNRSINICPEDATIYLIAKDKTSKISFRDFYGSSVIHFRDKNGMLEYAKAAEGIMSRSRQFYNRHLGASMPHTLHAVIKMVHKQLLSR